MNILNQIPQFHIDDDTRTYYDSEYLDIDYSYLNTLEEQSRLRQLRHLLSSHVGSTVESPTRMLKSSYFSYTYDSSVYYKLEGDNITGSYKDRETELVFDAVKERGIKEVCICSSGNAAISAAYFAQKDDIECNCFIPQSTSQEKVSLIKKYNGKIRTFIGDYSKGYRVLKDSGNKYGVNITPGIMSIRSEANKSIAFEIVEQLGKAPDYLVIPIGNGSCYSGIWKGFYDLYRLKLIKHIPIHIGVCHITSNPIGLAIRQKLAHTKVEGDFNSFYAEGIIGGEAFCSPKVIHIITRNDGCIVEVDDSDIKFALQLLKEHDRLTTEPTSASSIAALTKFGNKPGSTTVLILTGRTYEY